MIVAIGWIHFHIEGRHRSVRIVVDDAIVARKDDFGENLRNTFASCKEIGKARIWAEVPIQFGSFMKDLSKKNLFFIMQMKVENLPIFFFG